MTKYQQQIEITCKLHVANVSSSAAETIPEHSMAQVQPRYIFHDSEQKQHLNRQIKGWLLD